jgi:hypothetical protein
MCTGYVNSGYSGGIALGRVALIWVNHKLGDRIAIYTYAVIVAG